jgi:hypothetical protein
VNAEIRRARAGSLEIDPASWIQNDLDTDLYDCCLMLTNRAVRSDRPCRDQLIRVCNIGLLPRGKRVTGQDLADRADAFARANAKIPADVPRIRDAYEGALLQKMIGGQWLPGFFSTMQYATGPDQILSVRRPQQEKVVQALMLLTVYNEVNATGILKEGNELRRSHGAGFDRSDAIQPAEAILVGFSNAPGPARLCYRKADRPNASWTPITPNKASVMYRILVPVK